MGSGEITLGVPEEEDWINNWKVFFKPFRLDDNIVIKPTWETLTDKKDDDIVVEIDPGTAFGSDSHETTKLCISQLKKYIKKDTELLDVGIRKRNPFYHWIKIRRTSCDGNRY